MDEEEGLQKNWTSTSDLLQLRVQNGTTNIELASLPLPEGEAPTVDGELTRSASIRGVSMRLVLSSLSSTSSATETEPAVTVTIQFFIMRQTDNDFQPLRDEGTQTIKVRIRTILSKKYCRLVSSESSQKKLTMICVENGHSGFSNVFL